MSITRDSNPTPNMSTRIQMKLPTANKWLWIFRLDPSIPRDLFKGTKPKSYVSNLISVIKEFNKVDKLLTWTEKAN